MARRVVAGSFCWRVMKISNPNNSAEVDAEAARHCAFLKERMGKAFYFSGEIRKTDDTYWGRFTIATAL